MKAYFHIISSKVKFGLDLLNRLCKPNPKYTKEKIEQAIAQKRNKTLILFELVTILIMVADMLARRTPIANGLVAIFSCTMVSFVLLLSCRYHPEVFRIFFNILVAIYGVVMIHQSSLSFHRSWMFVQSFPIIVFLFTGSLWHYILQNIVQLIFVNRIYQQLMVKSVQSMSSEAFALSLTKAATSTALINMIGILCIHLCIRSAFNKASEAEKKKQEFKRQKTFLLGFSHELRNLINSLMGNVKLASFEDISEKAKDFLRNADVCGELLIHLVNNILDTGKVEIGDLEINPIPVDIYDTLERIWSVCSELIKRKNLNGTMRIHKDLPKVVKIDHYRLTQIFLNLIGNATKFTENGSIDVTVEWISNTEKVNAECFEPRPFDDDDELSEGIFEKCKSFSVLDENFLVLTTSHKKNNRNLLIPIQSTNRGILKVVVNDTGCGISKENVTKLFQKFTQVTSDLSKRKLGTGLGLFITKELCERMNGEIRVFSKENKGSCFMFCLPVDPIIEEVRSPLKGSNRVEVRAQRRLKAMVVDDIPFCHTVLKNYFQLLDIDVSGIAENGLEAYRKYVDYANKKEYLHIVTMDLDMPVMNGKKSAEKIREFEAEKGIENCFMVIVSANCTESEIKECLDINGKMKANAFLKKPVNISELSRIISEQFKQESPRFSN